MTELLSTGLRTRRRWQSSMLGCNRDDRSRSLSFDSTSSMFQRRCWRVRDDLLNKIECCRTDSCRCCLCWRTNRWSGVTMKRPMMNKSSHLCTRSFDASAESVLTMSFCCASHNPNSRPALASTSRPPRRWCVWLMMPTLCRSAPTPRCTSSCRNCLPSSPATARRVSARSSPRGSPRSSWDSTSRSATSPSEPAAGGCRLGRGFGSVSRRAGSAPSWELSLSPRRPCCPVSLASRWSAKLLPPAPTSSSDSRRFPHLYPKQPRPFWESLRPSLNRCCFNAESAKLNFISWHFCFLFAQALFTQMTKFAFWDFLLLLFLSAAAAVCRKHVPRQDSNEMHNNKGGVQTKLHD